MKGPKKMGNAWYFSDGEVWAKCQECGAWKRIYVKLDTFKRSPEQPYQAQCPRGHEMNIQRVWFARKGLEKPEREG